MNDNETTLAVLIVLCLTPVIILGVVGSHSDKPELMQCLETANENGWLLIPPTPMKPNEEPNDGQ